MRLSWTYVAAIIIAVIAFVGLVICTVLIFTSPFDLAALEKYGSFVGGFIGSLFSMAGFLLLFEAIVQQQRIFEKQQFESKFFDLLKIHRENMSEMRKRIPIKGDKYEEGRRVFVLMRKEFGELIEIVRNLNAQEPKPLPEKEVANLAYLVFYFGVSETLFNKGQNQTTILREKLLTANHNEAFVNKLIDTCSQYMDEENQYIKFNGNQARLGHYFRHLFQVVKFVDQSKIVNESEKYFYLKTLRAQLSSHEQLLLFYSVISEIGRSWLEPVNYISKYRLIKNLPLERGFTYNVNPADYFNIQYEDAESPYRTKM